MDPVEPTAPETDAPATDAPAPAAEPSAPEGQPSTLDALEAALDDWTGDEPAEQPEPAEKPAQPSAGEPKAEAEKPEATKPAEPKAERSFTLVKADGTEAEIQWPEGAKVVFKSDGKERKVESFDRLVDLAQKGDLLDRKASEFGRQKQDWTAEKNTLTTELQSTRGQVEEAERVLRAVLTDPEAAKRVKAALAHHDDPLAKRARESEEENERLKAEREKETETKRAQATERFWAKAQERIADSVGEGKRFPLLAEEDASDILGRYWERYEQHTVELFQGYVEQGVAQEDAETRAAAEGLKWLTEENLYGVMDELNARYARRFGQPRQDPAQREPDEDPEEQELARAEQHNARVERKLEQRATSRTIKGPAAPARSPAPAATDGGDYESAIDKEFEALAGRLG